ncbi:MAG: hydrogenase nickel incorporation protein HypB [Sphingomonadales bacterium]|nr:hydrogenase nickel incorporation protein HypB [Sphingomonadales bacterium]MBD3772619.1 hydrogenase nickel incorporation protein HypB [Paracoccaceae bacterium]
MCQECGCATGTGEVHVHDGHHHHHHHGPDPRSIEVVRDLLHANDHAAAHNRDHMRRHGVVAINLMSSPGAGKTALLEATIDALAPRWRIAVVEGDLETDNDARRIRAKGVPAVQVTTGQTCHLDAGMVHEALHQIDLDAVDLLFIENVGNLVCPAGFDLGQDANVVLLAVTEGDDKPAKYPVMFRAADLVLLSKSDLLAVLDDFSPERAAENVRALANGAPVETISAKRPESLKPWFAWLEARLAAAQAPIPAEAAE